MYLKGLNEQKLRSDQRDSLSSYSLLLLHLGLTLFIFEICVGLGPVQLHAVEADQVLQVHEDNSQRVELIGQPEISKAHSVERSGDHSELTGTGGRKMLKVLCISIIPFLRLSKFEAESYIRKKLLEFVNQSI